MEKPQHREELHKRIIERLANLTATRDKLAADAHTKDGEQCRAVTQAMTQVETHLASGWENIGEEQAAQLSHWLETTKLLPQPSPAKS